MKAFLLILFATLIAVNVSAQELKELNLTNVVTNEKVTLETYPACEGMVIIFATNNCPYDEHYRNRIAKLAEAYHDRVPVLLVNSSPEPSDSRENMIRKAKESKLTVPYLDDKDQVLMNALEARKSPEAFLLKNNGGKFTVVYRGSIDDNAQVEADVRKNYLRDAIDIMLSKQKIETKEVRPVGCTLKKKG